MTNEDLLNDYYHKQEFEFIDYEKIKFRAKTKLKEFNVIITLKPGINKQVVYKKKLRENLEFIYNLNKNTDGTTVSVYRFFNEKLVNYNQNCSDEELMYSTIPYNKLYEFLKDRLK